jgi:hypothetical protein
MHHVFFFKDGKEWGSASGFRDLTGARNFAETASTRNGADTYVVWDESSGKQVWPRARDAQRP